MHGLPDGWKFNGDLERPTFTPSFLHSGKQTVKVNGRWTGDWVRDADGKPLTYVCHYLLTNGILHFCSDCTHDLAGKSVPLPPLPKYFTDDDGIN